MNKTNLYINEDETKIYTNSKGLYHRLDGPAIEYLNGDKSWYKEGRRHRENGPAIEYPNGTKYWYILYKRLEERKFNSWIFRIKIFI